MKGREDYKAVEEYMNQLSERTKNKLIELRECIYRAAPDAIEMINYNIPAYALVKGGKRDQQVMIAGYKNHVGLYPGADAMEEYAEALKGYKQGKGSVQFSLNEPLPADLIADIVAFKRQKVLSEKR
ncbi:MAG: DUF1801 domain-containing protein [Clostridia bacterium]|nr:DUF1801 domain-containing protein [Clostridia bacterium]